MCARPRAPPPSSAMPMAGRPGGCTAGRAEATEAGARFVGSPPHRRRPVAGDPGFCAAAAAKSRVAASRIAADFQRTGTPPGEKPVFKLPLSRGHCSDGRPPRLLRSGCGGGVAQNGSMAQRNPSARKTLPCLRAALGEACGSVLLRRGRRESFASLRGFRFRLWLGRLLDFFSTFVFASHGCKCATKGRA